MNLSELEAMLYARLGFSATTVDAVTTARLLSYLNETQRQILGKKGFKRLRFAILPFSSVSGSPYAVLPQAAVQVSMIRDPSNRRLMGPMSLADLRYEDPGLAFSTSVPYAWTLLHISSPVAVQPADASELFVISTSAADGATKTAFLEGVDAAGYPRSASAVLNGITAVSFGATITNWTEITKFYVALAAGGVTTAAGQIQLREDSGIGALLSTIPVGRSYPRYTRIQLYPTPAAIVTYYADVELHINNMTQMTDEPILPEDFHDLLTIGSLMKEYSRREKPVQYAEEKAMWKERIAELQVFVGKMSGEARRRDRSPGFSQLGPYYPSGT